MEYIGISNTTIKKNEHIINKKEVGYSTMLNYLVTL